jgi:hypothetical protein
LGVDKARVCLFGLRQANSQSLFTFSTKHQRVQRIVFSKKILNKDLFYDKSTYSMLLGEGCQNRASSGAQLLHCTSVIVVVRLQQAFYEYL